jgi:hypothetical protein
MVGAILPHVVKFIFAFKEVQPTSVPSSKMIETGELNSSFFFFCISKLNQAIERDREYLYI